MPSEKASPHWTASADDRGIGAQLEQHATETLNVLLVEDSDLDTQLLIAELSRAGLEIEHERVWTPERLEEALDSRRWDVIISDYSMPGFSGLDALRIVRSRDRVVPFIIVSGAIAESVAVEAMRAGANDYISKASLLRLAPAVQREVAEYRSHTAKDAFESTSLAQAAFIRSMGHDFKTPLAAIVGFSELMLDGRLGPLTEQQMSSVVAIHNAGNHLSVLANAILDLSLIEAGALTLTFSPVDLSAILEECVGMARLPAAEKNLALRVEMPEPIPIPVSDPVRLRQILQNLVGNAVKFTDEGSVCISVIEPQRGFMAVRVADTGRGVSPAFREAVFGEFTRERTAAAGPPVEGTGLGLAISRRLAEALGGSLTLEDNDGEGTVVTLVLPMRPASAKSRGVQYPP